MSSWLFFNMYNKCDKCGIKIYYIMYIYIIFYCNFFLNLYMLSFVNDVIGVIEIEIN